jgi:DeoR/GlpR family transcriptional regulator of sugar metabolism
MPAIGAVAVLKNANLLSIDAITPLLSTSATARRDLRTLPRLRLVTLMLGLAAAVKCQRE